MRVTLPMPHELAEQIRRGEIIIDPVIPYQVSNLWTFWITRDGLREAAKVSSKFPDIPTS